MKGVLSLLLLSVLVFCCFAAKNTVEIVEQIASVDDAKAKFHLKPDLPGEIEVSVLAGDVQCIFKFLASGGTSEEWLITIDKGKHKWECKVERPNQSSYLFFKTFSLQLKGVDKETIEAEVFGPSGALLRDEAWVLQKGKVKIADNWGGNISAIFISGEAKPK